MRQEAEVEVEAGANVEEKRCKAAIGQWERFMTGRREDGLLGCADCGGW
jgi:hypothetical protein